MSAVASLGTIITHELKMADKDGDDSSHSFSGSESEVDEISDSEKNENTIPSIPPLEPEENREDNSAAIELFLEQVAATTTTTNTNTTTTTTNTNTTTTEDDGGKVKDKEREVKRAQRMMIPPECKCHLNSGQPCHTRFSVGELMDTRMHYMSISKKELDIAVLAKLECGIHLTKMTTRKKRKPTERKKHRTDFYHHGYRICNLVFVYLHGFSYKKLKALIIQYKTNGVRTRIHKNLKPKPPQCEGKPKKKKTPKPKSKPKPKETKPKRPQVKKENKEKTLNDNSEGVKAMQQFSSKTPCTLPPSLPPPPPPPPPPPQQHPAYPVAFSLSSEIQANHPQTTAFLARPPNPQPPYPPPVGYNTINSASVLAAHPLQGPSSHPHPGVMAGHPHPPLDYSSQRVLATPALDYSGQRVLATSALDFSGQHTNPATNMQGFQGSGRPCLTYSVVHSVTF